MLGLQRGIVKLSDHKSEWHDLFLEEKRSLEGVLGDTVLAIEHIGSTSIPGIKAKPILDLMIAVPSMDEYEKYIEPLQKLGYQFRTDWREGQGHVLFVKGPEEKRTHYLKLTNLDEYFWVEHILFRDYLKQNPEYKKEYQDLKESLLKEHGGVREFYTKGKEAFVKSVIELAKSKREGSKV